MFVMLNIDRRWPSLGQGPLRQMDGIATKCWFSKWTLCNKYNRKEIVTKMSPKIIPEIVQKPSLKSSQISLQQSPQNCQNKCKYFPLKMCVYNYKYKRQCMLECRKYGVVSKMKTSSLLPICIESNGM